ncbi:alpha/beta fold hydrolase [Thioalkalivibrio sulfidiphilus]|uniref:alpha/beta fold hydrolase n=1 Tax=Thioalkalivibrio sulfidiphilus TaxID=1033854 RepID=UPI00036F0439|nr:alpha/beta fold hydrolase [Thioalkalivibrio sulfidiphilus]
MIPIHFGSRDRLMLGIYSPAAVPRKRRGVLFLNPWGIEAMRAHRSIKQLSDILVRAGHDSFRFDYYGTGDSFGDDRDVTLSGCVDDAEWALDELLGAASVAKVTVVGLRLGGLVAGQLAARRAREIDQVVFWDAPPTGRAYLEELSARASIPVEDFRQQSGYEISPTFRDELLSASLDGLPGTRAKVLVASSAASVDPAPLGLKAKSVDALAVESLNCWEEERDFGAGAVPVELCKGIAAWVA